MDKIPLSIVILAKNEEGRITDCIKSVAGLADEIIVVNDDSSDRTGEVAKGLGAKVLVRKMDIEGRHRNWAYAQALNEWVFSLDADERVTEELRNEIRQALSSKPEANAFTMPRKNFIGDYWIKGGGLYPSPQIKLFRKAKFKWEEVEVHPRAFLEGGCAHLTKDLVHYTYRNWEDFLNKLNNQTTREAKKWYNLSLQDPKKANYKMNTVHAFWRVLDRFVRTYFFKKGYQDGFIGVMIAYFSSLYQIVSYAKYREMHNAEKRSVGRDGRL